MYYFKANTFDNLTVPPHHFSQPEDSGAEISNGTNLVLSKACTSQFTLSSNQIRYENGTINSEKPYVTNGKNPRKGNRVSL